MRRQLERLIARLPLGSRARRALDETLQDWKHESAGAAHPAARWWCDIRSATAVLRTLTMLGWQQVIRGGVMAADDEGFGKDQPTREEIINLIRKLSSDKSYDEILKQIEAARAARVEEPGEPASATRRPAASDRPEPYILHRLSTIYRYRLLITMVAVLVVMIGVARVYTMTPMYRATTTVRVEMDGGNLARVPPSPESRQSLFPEPEYFMQTEFAVIKSRGLMRAVVRKLNLTANPEFNGGRAAGSGSIATASVAGSTNESRESFAEMTAVNALVSKVSIEPQAATLLFRVSAMSVNPETAAAIANAIADEYAAQNLERKTQRVRELLASQRSTTADLKAKVEATARLQASGLRTNGLLDGEVLTRTLTNSVQDLTRQAAAVEVAQQKHDVLKSIDLRTDLEAAFAIPEVAASPVIQQYRASLDRLRLQRQNMLRAQGLGQASRLVQAKDVEIADAIDMVRKEIERLISADATRLESEKAAYQTASRVVEVQRRLQSDNARLGVSYRSLQSEFEVNRGLYNDSLKQLQAVELLLRGLSNNIRVVEKAQPPASPFSPDKARGLLMSLALAVFLSFSLAFLLSYLSRRRMPPGGHGAPVAA